MTLSALDVGIQLLAWESEQTLQMIGLFCSASKRTITASRGWADLSALGHACNSHLEVCEMGAVAVEGAVELPHQALAPCKALPELRRSHLSCLCCVGHHAVGPREELPLESTSGASSACCSAASAGSLWTPGALSIVGGSSMSCSLPITATMDTEVHLTLIQAEAS